MRGSAGHGTVGHAELTRAWSLPWVAGGGWYRWEVNIPGNGVWPKKWIQWTRLQK